MYSDGGHEVDGSWVLRVYVTDLQVERSLRVKGELHIGGVMLRLVEDLGESSLAHVHYAHVRLSLFFRSPLFRLSSRDAAARVSTPLLFARLPFASRAYVRA